MFDDPKKELKTLEQKLLADEEVPESAMLDEAEFEALYNEILAEYGPREEKAPSEPPVRNFANGYGFYVPPKTEITLAVPEDAWPAMPEPEAEQSVKAAPEAPKTKGNGGLILTICLEAIAIAAVLGLWILSLMG